jgi:hypothetical protein
MFEDRAMAYVDGSVDVDALGRIVEALDRR